MQINVLEYLEETTRRHPNITAVSDKSRKLSFRELRQASLHIARRLLATANVTCQPIAIYLPKSVEAIISLAGVLYSGNCYVPLDTKTPFERLRTILENLAPTSIITNSKLFPTLLAAGYPEENIIIFDEVATDGLGSGCEELAQRHQQLIDTDPVYLIYTSGSTGIPKGVAIPHRAVIDYIDWANSVYQFSEADVIGSQAPLFFDNSTLDIYLCFSRGATLHLLPEEIFAFPVKLVEHLRDSNVTTIFWVPSLLTTVANFDILTSVKPDSLDKVLFAGEVMPARTLNYWRRHLPSALFSNLYGPTEITVDCTYYIVDRLIADDEPVPIGFPCRNSDVLILNEHNEPAVEGEIGELCVRGSSLALGYWNAPEKTNAAFVQNPLRPQYPERIYRTGDLVHRNHLGEIIFIGRKDSQIKHQGYRIELGEIETAAGLLDGVRCACVLYNHPKQEITLFYEAAEEFLARDLRDRLTRSLPRYMLPTAFKWLASMPMNANGKTDRCALANRYF